MKLDEAIGQYTAYVDAEKMGITSFTINTREAEQLAEWLKALKEVWDSGDCSNCRRYKCEYEPELGQLVRYNCPHYVGISNGEVDE